MRSVTPRQCITDLAFLNNTWPKQQHNLIRLFGTMERFKIRAASYRVEFTVTLFPPNVAAGAPLCSHLTNLCFGLEQALLFNTTGIRVQPMLFSDYTTRCAQYLQLQHKIDKRGVVRGAQAAGSEGEAGGDGGDSRDRLYLSPLANMRLAYLRNVFGIADLFVVQNLRTVLERPLPSLAPGVNRGEYLWSNAAEHEELSAERANVDRGRQHAEGTEYHCTLESCGGNELLFNTCKQLYQARLVFNWQHGLAKSAKFMVFTRLGRTKSNRTRAFVCAGELLRVCAQTYLDHCRNQRRNNIPFEEVFNFNARPHPVQPNIVFE